jgi:hypothetical protein
VADANAQQGLEAAQADDAAEESVDKQQKAEAGNGVAATTATTVDTKPEREDGEQGVVEKMEEEEKEQGDDKDNGSAAVETEEPTTTKETKMKTTVMTKKKKNGQEEESEQEDDDEEEKDEFIFVSSHINASIVEKLKALRAALLTGTHSARSTRAAHTHTHHRTHLTTCCPLICNVCSMNRGRCGNPDRGQGLCLRLTAQRGHRFPHLTPRMYHGCCRR